jgi:hypothetical protein
MKSNTFARQVHDTSDTASAGSPANTISSSTPTASGSSSTTAGSLPMPFPQVQDAKTGDKLTDVAVVSLVAPSPMASQQPQANNPPTSSREDYDSSATVRLIVSGNRCVFLIHLLVLPKSNLSPT